MKVKENNEKISLGTLPVVFIISVVAAVVIRTLQMFRYIDHETGFTIGSAVVGNVFYVAIAVACLYFIIMSYLSKQSSFIEIHGIKNIPAAIGCILFAVSLMYDWVNSFMQTGSVTINPTGNAFKDMMSSGLLPLIMQSAFALLTAVFMIILAKDFLKQTHTSSKRKILCLAPLGWVGFRLIHCFIRQISFIRVSELFCELIMLSFMMLFFLAFAQVNSSVYSDGFRWRIPAFGYSAALIAVTLSVARLIYTVVNSAGSLNSEHPFNITDLMFSVFAFTVVFALTDKKAISRTREEINS